MRLHLSRILVACAALVLGGTLQAAPTLAGHPGLAGQSLDADGVKAVLLGKRVTLGNTRVVLVIAKTSPAQDSFLQSQVAMTTSQFQNHWRRLFMTGGGSAPKIVENVAEACKVAAETPGAVVLVDESEIGALIVLTAAK